jgi:DNA-binding NarL/FixJ family response regulator
MSCPKKILVADSQAIVREGLKRIIGTAGDMVVADEVGSCLEVPDRIRGADFDALVMDMSHPVRDCLDMLVVVKRRKPQLPVLIISAYPEEQYALSAYISGASGYLAMHNAAGEIVAALRQVIQGKTYLPPDYAECLIDMEENPDLLQPHQSLSIRERQILCMIGAGKTVTRIAAELSLSVKTISTHKAKLLGKLNMKNSAELTRYVLENKLILTDKSDN